MLSKTNHIQDALGNLEHELKVADAVCFILWDKAHYFVQMCEETANYIDRAQQFYQELRETIAEPEE